MREWDQGRPLGYAIWVETWKMEAAVKEMRFIRGSVMVKRKALELDWAGHLSSLCLSYPICKVG